LSLSIKRENDEENWRGVFARVSTVCVVVDSLIITGICGICLTGIRAGFDVATGFITGGRRNGVSRVNRLAARDEPGGAPVSFRQKKNNWDKNK